MRFERSIRLGVTAAFVAGSAIALTGTVPTSAAEVGPDDFQISQSQPTPSGSRVAYNATDEEYLVVWQSVDANNEARVYGRIIDARTGLGDAEFLIAEINGGDPGTGHVEPDVVWNSVDNEYVVVSAGDDTSDGMGIVTTFEIYAQRVGADGTLVGGSVRVSDLGTDDVNGNFDANEPSIAHDPVSNQYLVVFEGDDDTAPLANNHDEIFGQLLAADLMVPATAANDVRLSDMGPDGDGSFDARNPAVAWDGTDYLVVWEGDDVTNGLFEIHGQYVAADGTESGADFLISTDAANDEAYDAEVAANTATGEVLVVWEHDDGFDDFEIEATFVDGTPGASFAVSEVGGSAFNVERPSVAYQPTADTFTVVWAGDHSTLTSDGDFEVFQVELDSSGVEVEAAAAISSMEAATTEVTSPDVAAGPGTASGVVWTGVDTAGADTEVWGQFVALDTDLEVVSKTLTSATNPGPGEPVVYEITYINNGPGDASDVRITDVIPAGVTINSVSSSGATLIPVAGPDYAWDIASLPSGTGGTITLTGVVAATATDGTVVSNTATIAVSGLAADSDATNDSKTVDFTVDARPSVTIEQGASQADPTAAGPVVFDVVFSEAVTGFDSPADVTIGGDAPGMLTAFIASVSATEYTVTVSGMTGDGTVTASIPADVANDTGPSTRANTASTTTDNTVTLDTTAPTVTVEQAAGQADPTNASPINFTATFSEDVTGFADGDVTVGGSAGATTATVTGGPAVYNIEVSGMTGDGTVTASIGDTVAADPAGNDNAVSTSTDNEVTYDATGPIPVIATAEPDPTNTDPFELTIDFGQTVSGFVDTDITVGNGTVTNLDDDGGGLFTATIDATADGSVTIDVAADAAADAAGNGNVAATSFTIEVDTTAPSLVVEQAAGQADPTNATTVEFTVTASEAVVGFDDADIVLAGPAAAGATAAVTGGPSVYTATVTGITVDGDLTASIPDGAAADAAGNTSTTTPSVDANVTVDMTAPTVTVEQGATQADPTDSEPVVFDVVFSEDVIGFDPTDLTIGGTTGSTTASVTAIDASTYVVEISGATADGIVTLDVAAGVIADAAGNPNAVSTSVDNEITLDTVAPTVTIEQGATQTDSANASPIVFDVVFSEPVTGFDDTDVDIAGSAGATTAVVTPIDASTYTIEITGMVADGTVIASIPVGAAVDSAGIDSEESTSTDNMVTFISGDPTPGVNDAPTVVAPASAAAELAVATTFTGADAVSATDPDALDEEIVVTVTADDDETIITVGAAGSATVAGNGTDAVTITGSQSDTNAVLASLSVTANNVGDITVTITADDQGNTDGAALTDSATTVITVTDTVAPTITAPAAVTASADPGEAGAIVSFDVTVDDPGSESPARLIEAQPAPTLDCDPNSGSFFPIGDTTVTCTATDASGNSSTESFVVTVTDDEDPVITGATDQQFTLPRGTSGPVTYTAPTATDNSGAATVSCSPASGSTLSAGPTAVTCTATDAAGNTATASFTLNVLSGRIPDTGGSLTFLPWAGVLLGLGLLLLGSVGASRRRLAR